MGSTIINTISQNLCNVASLKYSGWTLYVALLKAPEACSCTEFNLSHFNSFIFNALRYASHFWSHKMGRRLCRRMALNPIKCLPGLWWCAKDTKLFSIQQNFWFYSWNLLSKGRTEPPQEKGKNWRATPMGPSHIRITALQLRTCWVWTLITYSLHHQIREGKGTQGDRLQNAAPPGTWRQPGSLYFSCNSPKLAPFPWSGQPDAEETCAYFPAVCLLLNPIPSLPPGGPICTAPQL